MRKKYLVPVYIILIVASVLSIFPFIWTFIAATHNNTQIFQMEYTFTPGTNVMENYNELVKFAPIWRNLLNSFFISAVYTLCVLILDSMAGYAFAKFSFKGRDTIFFIILCSMFIPSQVTMIPLYLQLGKMKMLNSSFAVIVPSLVNVFGVFMIRQHMYSFPNELLDAARIDGAGEFRIFFSIVLPSLKPALASLGIISFVNQWGNYLWPLIVLNQKENYTMPLVLSLMVAPGQVVKYGALILGAVLSIIPVLLIFLKFQKSFISGILGGAVKG